MLVCATKLSPAAPLVQPSIEGKIHAVSSSDVQSVIDQFRKSYVHSGKSVPQILRVLVVDGNHVALHYRRGSNEYEVFERRDGKWQGGRIIIVGEAPNR